METQSYAQLTIISEILSPELIDSRVGLAANKVRRKGAPRDPDKGNFLLEKENRWTVRSTISKEEPIEAHVQDLLDSLAPYIASIRALADESTVVFTCVVYVYSEEEYNQEVYLSPENVDLISAMGASMWVDTYFLGSNDE